MRRTTATLMVGGLLVAPGIWADTLRCGSQLINTGDRAFEVERRCGPPIHRDVIGYAVGANQRYELVVEEWVYGPDNGMLRILTFEGNRLVDIEARRDR